VEQESQITNHIELHHGGPNSVQLDLLVCMKAIHFSPCAECLYGEDSCVSLKQNDILTVVPLCKSFSPV